jgi:uncharacterized protein YodC (DUF2158 family)
MSEAMRFKTGDVVRLKSGGPDMTVNGFSNGPNEEPHCAWFDGDVLRESYFYDETLVLSDDGGAR